MKLQISVQWSDGWSAVEAELLPDIAPHIAHLATFAIMRDPWYGDRWQVANLETGLSVVRHKVKAECIEAARGMLAEKTPQIMGQRYRLAKKDYPQIRDQRKEVTWYTP